MTSLALVVFACFRKRSLPVLLARSNTWRRNACAGACKTLVFYKRLFGIRPRALVDRNSLLAPARFGAVECHSGRCERGRPFFADRGSGSAARWAVAISRMRCGSSRASAQTAAPRTSGEASASSRSALRASAASPELPIAISTLRTKRSRPMRLTGDLANSARKAASSSRARSASARRPQRVARGELRLAAGLRELVPRAHRQAIVAAVDAVAHRGAQLARDRALVLDGEIGDAAPRIEPVGRRETPRSGRCRGRRGSCRNDRSRARRAAARAW